MNKPTVQKPRALSTLNVLAATFMLISLVSQNRLISLGDYYICATIFAYPMVVALLDIIAEIYGYKIARETLLLIIISTFIFATVVTIFTKLSDPPFWHAYSNSFNTAMSPLLRTVSVGTISLLIGQFINIYVITKLKLLVKGRFFALRCMSASIIGDTVTFCISLFGFFANKMNVHEIIVITVTELALMYLFAILLSFPSSLVVTILKNLEPANIYNPTINFNPFAKDTR